jgi:hypothetical protein
MKFLSISFDLSNIMRMQISCTRNEHGALSRKEQGIKGGEAGKEGRGNGGREDKEI